MKTLTTFLACFFGFCGAGDQPADQAKTLSEVNTRAGFERQITDPFDGQTMTGNYLSSYFAQRHHDWGAATRFMENVLDKTPEDATLLKRAMVLAMGSGKPGTAISYAEKVYGIEEESALGLLFLVVDAFKKQDYKQASTYIKEMPEGSLTEFILPILDSWAQAAQGVYDAENLNQNIIHIHHAILIADYLDQHQHIEKLLQMALTAESLTIEDIERIADIYAHIGNTETAMELYTQALKEVPEHTGLVHKIEGLKDGKITEIFKPMKSPEQGIAAALYDMAYLLYQDYSDDTARVFGHMAMYLDPDMVESKILLANITARNERYDEAIGYYQKISDTEEIYVEARRRAADLMEETDRIEEALSELQTLVDKRGDLESLIQIGDIYRRNEEYDKAVMTYNQAAKRLGDTIPEEYWNLYYVRGMSYEQLGKWDKAESDLKAALAYQPDHPFILNYLGYAWADQGKNLKQSLEFIQRASALRPGDGYIKDSLGWVNYRMGNFSNAVPALEKAVELLPYDPVINDHLGDAYWHVGRKLEAKFQWMRAKNHSEDPELIEKIEYKMSHGLQAKDFVKEARSQAGSTEETMP